MKSFAALLLLAGRFAWLTEAAVCNRDSCLHAVLASASPSALGTAHCSSYLLKTVTPATVTVTDTTTNIVTIANSVSTTVVFTVASGALVTSTVTSTLTLIAATTAVAKRQMTNSPSNIPAYASACSGAVRYSSACSCIGVTVRTTTVIAPTSTASLTESSTTSTSITSTIFGIEFTTITRTQLASATATKGPGEYGCVAELYANGFVNLAHNCGAGSRCFCAPLKEGGGTCIDGNQRCDLPCDSSANCPLGRACIIRLYVCSSNPNQGYCQNAYQSQCLNAAAPNKLFRRSESGLVPEFLDVAAGTVQYINGKVGLSS